MAVDSLTAQECAILDLEQQWWATAGGKEDAIAAMGLLPHALLPAFAPATGNGEGFGVRGGDSEAASTDSDVA